MIGRSMLAYIPVNLANIVVSFGTVVILTRLLSAAEFGRYAVAIITMQFAHMAIFTWIEAAMARFQARAEKEGDVAHHLKTLYSLGAGMCLFASLFFAVFYYFIPLTGPMKTVIGFALASTCIQVFFNIGMEAHRASHRIKRYSLSFSFQTLLSFSLGIILILTTPLREIAPFIGIMIGVSFVLIFDLLFMLPKMKGGKFSRVKTKDYAAYALPISLSLLLSYALNSADVYLIAGYMGEASAGEYNAGYNLANRSLEIIFVWLAMAVTPLAVSAFEQDGAENSKSIMRDYGATLLLIALPAATGIALVAKDAGFIMGESVRDNAVTVMPLIAFAGVLNGFINYYVQRAFMLSGATKSFAWVMLPPFIMNIGLNLWLIPLYGLMGAVYATVAAYSLGAVLSMIIARRHYPLPLPIKALGQISVACGLMSISVLTMPWPEAWPDAVRLILKAGWGAFVYGFACWVMNIANCRNLAQLLRTKFSPTRNNDSAGDIKGANDIEGAVYE
ncbi:O-antigen/teichoic acid export membrane protein [Litorimonas taeanensis]|uniref:O-antigen/teichoic acid export membrane protein n=1 Tax=Litorimonas taeanensis TaxID=568099 RepID=A0A420WLK1_9PROT|nr:polysaccharide biosynthesis C-terminal domain-containing protein [Litorimonas taeanensis]RKQ71903.1 O-antigen/teichoic acid export membrane protein [Litorimonas taeanensis]